MEVRRADGKEYTGETLHQLVCGVQRCLRDSGRHAIDFFQMLISRL